jgi:hypothetical protein
MFERIVELFFYGLALGASMGFVAGVILGLIDLASSLVERFRPAPRRRHRHALALLQAMPKAEIERLPVIRVRQAPPPS